jgi:hypothetical protein
MLSCWKFSWLGVVKTQTASPSSAFRRSLDSRLLTKQGIAKTAKVRVPGCDASVQFEYTFQMHVYDKDHVR